jgi:hypothetical protein
MPYIRLYMLDSSAVWQTALLWLVCCAGLLAYRMAERRRRCCAAGEAAAITLFGRAVAATLLGWLAAMIVYLLSTVEFGNAARDGRPRFSEVAFAKWVIVGAIIGLSSGTARGRRRWTFSLRSLMLFVVVTALLVVLVRGLDDLFFGR